jgi:hypothetical protein
MKDNQTTTKQVIVLLRWIHLDLLKNGMDEADIQRHLVAIVDDPVCVVMARHISGISNIKCFETQDEYDDFSNAFLLDPDAILPLSRYLPHEMEQAGSDFERNIVATFRACLGAERMLAVFGVEGTGLAIDGQVFALVLNQEASSALLALLTTQERQMERRIRQ